MGKRLEGQMEGELERSWEAGWGVDGDRYTSFGFFDISNASVAKIAFCSSFQMAGRTFVKFDMKVNYHPQSDSSLSTMTSLPVICDVMRIARGQNAFCSSF